MVRADVKLAILVRKARSQLRRAQLTLPFDCLVDRHAESEVTVDTLKIYKAANFLSLLLRLAAKRRRRLTLVYDVDVAPLVERRNMRGCLGRLVGRDTSGSLSGTTRMTV